MKIEPTALRRQELETLTGIVEELMRPMIDDLVRNVDWELKLAEEGSALHTALTVQRVYLNNTASSMIKFQGYMECLYVPYNAPTDMSTASPEDIAKYLLGVDDDVNDD